MHPVTQMCITLGLYFIFICCTEALTIQQMRLPQHITFHVPATAVTCCKRHQAAHLGILTTVICKDFGAIGFFDAILKTVTEQKKGFPICNEAQYILCLL